jgi:hypothetical protein
LTAIDADLLPILFAVFARRDLANASPANGALAIVVFEARLTLGATRAAWSATAIDPRFAVIHYTVVA